MNRQRRLIGVALVLTLGAVACGGAQGIRDDGGLCKVGESHLRQKLGPEFGKVHSKVVFNLPEKDPHGCVLVYSRIPEELPMEMTGDIVGSGASDHMLCTVFTDARKQPRFTRVPRSRTAPGPVTLKLSKRDINGDNVSDLVVEERGPAAGLEMPYRGLRLFDGNIGGGRELFSGALLMTTKDGMRVTPKWKVLSTEQKSSLVFSAAGINHTYVYDPKIRRFKLQTVPKQTKVRSTATTPNDAETTPNAPAKTPDSKKLRPLPATSKER